MTFLIDVLDLNLIQTSILTLVVKTDILTTPLLFFTLQALKQGDVCLLPIAMVGYDVVFFCFICVFQRHEKVFLFLVPLLRNTGTPGY